MTGHLHKIEKANSQIRNVTHISIGVNIGLAILKIVVGLLGKSMALVADGIHSVSDMTTDLAVLVGVHFGSKEADLKHPYGHGRIETFTSLGIALVLVILGIGMIYRAGIDITKNEFITPGFFVVVIAIISIVVKELLYRITKKVAINSYSSALYANAWHHRSDALSSVVVVTGLVSMMLGFKYGDRIAAMSVGLMITLIGGQIVTDCFNELTEGAVDEDTVRSIEEIINADSQVHQWHKLRTRTVGRELFLDLHILVEPELNIAEAHQIAENLENVFHKKIHRPVNITVHIEPDLPELRK